LGRDWIKKSNLFPLNFTNVLSVTHPCHSAEIHRKVKLSNIPGRRTREDVGRGEGSEKYLEGARTSGRCLEDTIRIHITYREVEDQRVRRVVPVFWRQCDIIFDLNVTSFVSESRGDFVNLDAVPCARSNTELNL
jgi:hypothetical protein